MAKRGRPRLLVNKVPISTRIEKELYEKMVYLLENGELKATNGNGKAMECKSLNQFVYKAIKNEFSKMQSKQDREAIREEFGDSKFKLTLGAIPSIGEEYKEVED